MLLKNSRLYNLNEQIYSFVSVAYIVNLLMALIMHLSVMLLSHRLTRPEQLLRYLRAN